MDATPDLGAHSLDRLRERLAEVSKRRQEAADRLGPDGGAPSTVHHLEAMRFEIAAVAWQLGELESSR